MFATKYYAVDPLVLWNILTVHLPILAPVIGRMIADLQDQG